PAPGPRRAAPRAPLPAPVPLVPFPSGCVQRIALPRLLSRRLRARRAAALACRRNRDRARDADTSRRRRAVPADAPAGVALAGTEASAREPALGARCRRALSALAPVEAPRRIRRSGKRGGLGPPPLGRRTGRRALARP